MKKRNFVVVYLFLFSTIAWAQKPNFNFKNIDQAKGLVNSTVQTMYQDSYGFIWIGTQHGVQRYDGKTFKNFEFKENDSTGLSGNYINDFCEDKAGNIWISSLPGLNVYNRKQDKIYRYFFKEKPELKNDNQMLGDIINDVTDPDILWISSFESGLIKLNISNDSVVVYKLKNQNNFSRILPNPANENKLLLMSDAIISFDKKTGAFDEILKLDEDADVHNNYINDAVFDPANKDIIWLATGDFWGRGNIGGLIRYNLKTGWKKSFNPDNRPDMSDKHLMCLCFDGNDKLWIGTRTKGALLYNKNQDQFYSYSKNEYDKQSFASSISVRSIIKDKSGTLWFGTWGEGISLLSPSLQKFSQYKYLPDQQNGLMDNYINAFTEDIDGNIWIGTKAGGLSSFNPRTKAFQNYFSEFIKHDGNSTEITYLFYDSRKNIWIGTYEDALYQYNPVTGIKKHYLKGSSNKNVTQRRISTINEIEKGKILVSTYGGGLNIYDYETDSFKHFTHDPDDSTSIPDNQIWLPVQGKDGNYYFSGNSTAGLIRFNPKTEKFSLTSISDETATFMMPCKISEEVIYINDVSTGLRELNFENELKVKTIYDANGNTIKNIESILADSNGHLWMGTGNGLVEFDPQTKVATRYDSRDGLQDNVFNRMAAMKATTGEMYFGGRSGFCVFQPEEIKKSEYIPPVVIVDFKLFQESINFDESLVLNQNILLSKKIVLDYNQNDFSFSFAALDYSNPDKIQYKYILENHDKNWINAGNNNTASYTNMDPGEYTLKILATNSDGVWIKDPKQLSIIINPPLWRTTWAYILYVIIFIAGVFGVDRIQRRRLLAKEKNAAKIREAELRAQLAESENERKTKELEEARELQLSMLPKELPKLPHLDIAVYMKTATEVGGDYYDFHVGIDGTLTVVIGDATGHGMKAGTMVTTAKSLFNSYAPNPDILFSFQEITRCIKQMNLGKMSMCMTMLKVDGNKMQISSAGMPPSFIFRRDTRIVEEQLIQGLPLGTMDNFKYKIQDTTLKPGDTILLLTDGLPELQNGKGELYSYKRVRNLFEEVAEKEPEDIINELKNDGYAWMNDKDPEDDVTFVVIKVK
jgi:serine phosphatase RsbU (regulator of sigma subunit)/ligand-binding sensor domain-containing protein